MKEVLATLSLATALLLGTGCTGNSKQTPSQPKPTAIKIEGANISRKIKMDNAHWDYHSTRPEAFNVFELKLENSSELTVTNIKYRLYIEVFRPGSFKDEAIFSKSFVYSDTLYPKDVITIPVKELEGFYVGVNLNELCPDNGTIQNDCWHWASNIESYDQIVSY